MHTERNIKWTTWVACHRMHQKLARDEGLDYLHFGKVVGKRSRCLLGAFGRGCSAPPPTPETSSHFRQQSE